MKKYFPLILLTFITCFTLACSFGNFLQKNKSIDQESLTDAKINQVVNDYFNDEEATARDAEDFLTNMGFRDLSFTAHNGEVHIDFEQFDNLLPEQMQFRYLIAFLTAERYQPTCNFIDVTVRVAGEPMVGMNGSCEDVRTWRHGELSLVEWYNRIQKTVLWDPGDSITPTQSPSQSVVTIDLFSWFLDHPGSVESAFAAQEVILTDPDSFYYNLYQTDDAYLCSITASDGETYDSYHEDSLMWDPGLSLISETIQGYQNSDDYVLEIIEETSLNGLRVVTWSVVTPPSYLRMERFGYIEFAPGSDEWFGFVVSETCIEQFGSHLPEPIELLKSLLESMRIAGYEFSN